MVGNFMLFACNDILRGVKFGLCGVRTGVMAGERDKCLLPDEIRIVKAQEW